MAQDAGDTVLPSSRITADRHLSLPRKIMPDGAVVRAGESRPRRRYPEQSVHLLSFAMAGLIPPFSRFFHEALDFYEIHALHLAPNAMMTLAIFAHLCEMFIGVRPTMRLFQAFFIPQLLQGAVVGGCYFQPRPGTVGQYIESHLRKKWEDWKKDWFYTALPDHPRLRVPTGPPERSAAWLAVSEQGEEYDAERSRGAWEYTGPNDPMRTHVDERWDWGEEDAKMVIRRVLGLDSAEQTLIPDGILPLCCDRNRESILAVMSVVGAGRSRPSRGGASSSTVGAGGGDATVGGSRTSGPGGGGGSRAPGLSRGPGDDSASDPKGKRKVPESRPPSPPRGGGAERATDRPPAGHNEIPSQGVSGSDPSRGTKSERSEQSGPGKSRAAGSSQPRGGTHRTHTGPDPERPSAGTRPAAGDDSGDVPPRGGSETRVHVERHPGSGGEGGHSSRVETRGGPEPEVEVEAGGGPELEVEVEARGGPEPEAEAESTRGPKAGGERDSCSPLRLGRLWGWSRRRGAESSPQSHGGSSSTPSSRGRTVAFSSPTPASMEPLLQVLAAADSTVREGLNVQGRRAVDDIVRIGRKMRQTQLAKIQPREEALDSIMRETEEERQAALIASSVLDEALGDIRLQYEAYAEDLARRIRDARGILDAAAAHERRASEADASLRARTAALEAERRALDDRARSAQEFEATIHRRIEVLDRSQCEQNARGQEQAQRAKDLEERACLLDQRESTLAVHERTAAEVEASLRLREEAAAERDRITLTAKASADHRAEELRLREEACRERDAALAEREAEVNRREVALRRLGEQLTKREEAVAGREAQHLESARAERAAIVVKASELEAWEKDLAAGGPPGGAGLVSQLAMAQNTLADLERLVQDQAGEIAALCLTNEIGPGQLSDAVDRLESAGRRVGVSVCRDSKLPPTQPALALRLDGLAADLERLEEEVGETIKSSSASLSRAVVELVLASHQARDPDFVPWRALEDFPPRTEAKAREQVREAADTIVSNFERSAPRFTFGLASDEESGSGGDDNDVGNEDWDDVISGAGLGGPGTP
uniref:Transposase (putative) gypsy type domain-containing protein n=2 Tax=Oryza sativa subsp. japonica TaxID=39947 RepID=Q60E91_ORYSJ|nr:hypothetical protein [Oryza sativa Japonica Group]